MSQLQYHCPASPMAAAPAPLPLGQPQPGYSIHCGSGTLPSESAGQPVRSSALPAGSATPYTTTTGYVVFIVFIGKKILFLSRNPSTLDASTSHFLCFTSTLYHTSEE